MPVASLPDAAASRPEATTFECVEYRALREPARLAVASGAERYSYAMLHAYAVRLTRKLAALGLRRGQGAAISLVGGFSEVAFVLACENLGVATASFVADGDPEAQVLFGLVDWVFSDLPQPAAPPGRFVLLDAAFAASLRDASPLDGQPHPRVAQELDEPQRYSRTSGSTGRAKWMMFTRQAQEVRIRRIQREADTYRPDSVLLMAQPFIVNGALTMALGGLRLGAAVAFVKGHELAGLRPTNFHGLPLTLERFLAEVPADYVFEKPVCVGVIGGFLHRRLRQRVVQRMGGPALSVYSTSEVSNICPALDESGEGVLSAGVDIRILDDADRALPAGQVGAIAVRSPASVGRYLDNPEATAAAFRDGWYVSGDFGLLTAPRRVRVLGRRDDLVVVGGLKVPTRELEEQVCALLDAPAAAVTGLRHAAGYELGIAVVPPPGLDRAAALARLSRELVLSGAVFTKVLFVETLPRTGNGKIDRVALTALFASQP